MCCVLVIFKGVYPCTGKLFAYKTLVNLVHKPCLRGHRTMTIKFAPAVTTTTKLKGFPVGKQYVLTRHNY